MMSSPNFDPALSLNLGFPPTAARNPRPPPPDPDSDFNLSLTLSLSAAADDKATATTTPPPPPPPRNHHAASPHSGVSSLSSGSKRRERDPPVPAASGTASEEVDRNHSSKSAAASDDDDEEIGGGARGNVRKKLRLTKDQSALLEDSFKLHNTLNPKQKLALANQLNLRPRQVEVWFQNRRARTKFKQTEVDCELLKKWCESLTNENRRLQKEVQELRALKVGAAAKQQFYMQLPAATLTICPSCERTSGAASTTTVGGELRRR